MNTQQLVALLKEDYAPGYSNLKLLSYIERAQNEMFNNDCEQMLFTNVSDPIFPVPFLATTDGELNYTPSVSNLVDSSGSPIALTVNGYKNSPDGITYSNRFMGDNFSWCGVNDRWRNLNDVSYSEIPIVAYDKSDIRDAGFTFVENPGDSTDRFYIEFYFGAVSLDSEQIPLSVDGDRWCEAFIMAVRGYIELSRNGRSELLDGPANTGSFRRYWIPKFRSSLNAAARAKKSNQFPVREV